MDFSAFNKSIGAVAPPTAKSKTAMLPPTSNGSSAPLTLMRRNSSFMHRFANPSSDSQSISMSDSNAAPASAVADGASGAAGQPVNAGVLLGGNPLKQQLNRSVSLAKKFVFGQAKENSRDAWDKEVRIIAICSK